MKAFSLPVANQAEGTTPFSVIIVSSRLGAGPAACARRLGEVVDEDLDDVLVADASKRTTAENAYVAGLGSSKRMVLYDTLLAAGSPAETRYVVAHELGHEAEGHVLKNVAISAVGLVAGFGVLAWLVTQGGFLRWAGAASLTDLRVLPALLLFALLAGLVFLGYEWVVTREAFSRQTEIMTEVLADQTTAIPPLPSCSCSRSISAS